MSNVYELCPVFESEKFLIRKVIMEDAKDLLDVYSDVKAVPLFNSDNCHGDTFYYTTLERMKEAMDFWIYSYDEKYFVRWSILDKNSSTAIGTIELFHRDATDYFAGFGILRLDLRSDFERELYIYEILNVLLKDAYDLFRCKRIATKAIRMAEERRKALEKLGFKATEEKLVGNDGTEYGEYYIR